MIQFLLWPFLAALVLTGIHAYLGFHVVERGVIFVDLSLAQVAALGATVAFAAGYDLHGHTAYWFSLGFTLLGAAVFAWTRSEKRKIPHEAIIGIVYAVSAALAILIVDKSPEGTEHIKYILVGNLLAVTPDQVLRTAALYGVIGALHWWWRKPFFAISRDPHQAKRDGYRIRLWDFLFYATFGFVVTSSVSMAGVLLVFTYLIVPSVAAILVADRTRVRLAFGWGLGAVASGVGLWASSYWDSPPGAAIICAFGTLLILVSAYAAWMASWFGRTVARE